VIKAVFSVSHDPSEIRLSILKTVVMVNIFFMETEIHYQLKVWVKILFLKNNTFHQRHVQMIKSMMLQKISISNKCCSFELSIHQNISHEFHNNVKQQKLFSKLVIIRTIINN